MRCQNCVSRDVPCSSSNLPCADNQKHVVVLCDRASQGNLQPCKCLIIASVAECVRMASSCVLPGQWSLTDGTTYCWTAATVASESLQSWGVLPVVHGTNMQSKPVSKHVMLKYSAYHSQPCDIAHRHKSSSLCTSIIQSYNCFLVVQAAGRLPLTSAWIPIVAWQMLLPFTVYPGALHSTCPVSGVSPAPEAMC